MNVWDYVVQIHRTGDVQALVLFWGVAAVVVLFVVLQVLLIRSRGVAVRAMNTVRDLADDMRNLRRELDELERRMEKRLDSRAAELDARMTKKLDQKGDLIQERLEERSSSLSDAISSLDGKVGQARQQMEAFRQRVDDVEGRIPGLFDRLDEFRDTLAHTFQAELGSVLTSFDNSMSAILQQMKAELQMGVSRIESIENMVRSREQAERSLLGPPEAAEPAEEGEFEEWEREAKELAEQPEESLEEELSEMAVEDDEEFTAEAEEDVEDESEEDSSGRPFI
ncbi:MAG: hypothetical protein PVJ27_04775 [Candidatus Brocadiaceae bacterium]|jgi:uncharacterized protein YukE